MKGNACKIDTDSLAEVLFFSGLLYSFSDLHVSMTQPSDDEARKFRHARLICMHQAVHTLLILSTGRMSKL